MDRGGKALTNLEVVLGLDDKAQTCSSYIVQRESLSIPDTVCGDTEAWPGHDAMTTHQTSLISLDGIREINAPATTGLLI